MNLLGVKGFERHHLLQFWISYFQMTDIFDDHQWLESIYYIFKDLQCEDQKQMVLSFPNFNRTVRTNDQELNKFENWRILSFMILSFIITEMQLCLLFYDYFLKQDYNTASLLLISEMVIVLFMWPCNPVHCAIIFPSRECIWNVPLYSGHSGVLLVYGLH